MDPPIDPILPGIGIFYNHKSDGLALTQKRTPLISVFVPLDKGFNIFTVYKYLFAHLNVLQLSIPYLRTPKPLGRPHDGYEVLDGQ
jgi:hypothetical protein